MSEKDFEESMNFLESIVFALNEGDAEIIDQKAFDKGINLLLDGIEFRNAS